MACWLPMRSARHAARRLWWRNTHFAAESGGSRVSVVEPADARKRDDVAVLGREFVAEVASAFERALTVHVAPDMAHDPPLFAAYHPAGAAALDEAAAFVKRALR